MVLCTFATVILGENYRLKFLVAIQLQYKSYSGSTYLFRMAFATVDSRLSTVVCLHASKCMFTVYFLFAIKWRLHIYFPWVTAFSHKPFIIALKNNFIVQHARRKLECTYPVQISTLFWLYGCLLACLPYIFAHRNTSPPPLPLAILHVCVCVCMSMCVCVCGLVCLWVKVSLGDSNGMQCRSSVWWTTELCVMRNISEWEWVRFMMVNWSSVH